MLLKERRVLNVLIPRHGSSGDVLPCIAIGWELKRRGHEVTFIGNPYFETNAVKAGLSFVPVGTLEDHERILADTQLFDSSTGSWKATLEKHYYPHLESFYHTTAALHVPDRTVIVGGEIATLALSQNLSVPFAAVLADPCSYFSWYDPPHPDYVLPGWARWLTRTRKGLALLHRLKGLAWQLRARRLPPHDVMIEQSEIAKFRKKVGLPARNTYQPDLALCMWPEWFAAMQPDWPASAMTTGFPFFPKLDEDSPAPPAESRGEDTKESRPIVFTTGSVASSHYEFFITAIEACKLLNRKAVLLTPNADHIPKELPEHAVHLKYAPYGELFAGADLVVHVGGIGATSYALAAGTPQIVLPMIGPQFDNGHRMERLGVGKMLARKKVGTAQLARVIHSVLSSHRISRRIKFWQSKIEHGVGTRMAADLIESKFDG